MTDQPGWGQPPTQPAPGGQPAWGQPVPPQQPQPAQPAWGQPQQPQQPQQPGWGQPQAAWGQPGQPAQPGWGQPAPGGWTGGPAPVMRPMGKPRGGMRTSIIAAALMIGVVGGVNMVNAAMPLPNAPANGGDQPAIPAEPVGEQPTNDPNNPAPEPVQPGPVQPGTTVSIGDNYTLVMPDGWTVENNADGWMVFVKGGAVLAIGNVGFDGSSTDLLTAYQDEWFKTGQFTGDQVQSGTIGNGIPVAATNYTGTTKDGGAIDGFILATAEKGHGMVINAFAAQGQLSAMGNDIDAILKSIKRAGE